MHILANFLSYRLMVLEFRLLVVRSWNFNVSDFSSWLGLSIHILGCMLSGYLNVSRGMRRRLLVSRISGGFDDGIARSWIGSSGDVATLLYILWLGLDVGGGSVEGGGGLVGDLCGCGEMRRGGQVIPVIGLLRVS